MLLLLRHEIRSLVRDRRTLFFALILPLLIYPAIFMLSKTSQQRQEKRRTETTYTYAIVGGEADQVREWIHLARESSQCDQADHDSSRNDEVQQPERGSHDAWRFEETATADPRTALERDELDFYVEAIPASANEAEEPSQDPEASSPLLRLVFRGNEEASRDGARTMRSALNDAREQVRERLLRERGLELVLANVYPIEAVDVASSGQAAGSLFGRFLTALVVFLVLGGGAAISADALAGEKERGTLETILTSAAGREEIVAAKFLAILGVALFITCINVVNLMVYVSFGVISMPAGFADSLPPLALGVLVLVLVPLAALLAGVLLLLSGVAKTYKEAQLYLLPAQLFSVVPALAAVLPEIQLRSAIVVVPLANVSVAVREVMVGRYDWPMLIVTVVVTTLAAVYVVRLAARTLLSERLITASERDASEIIGGPALLPRRFPLWLAGTWGLFLIVGLNLPQTLDVRWQVLINLVGIFIGSTALMVWRYRLPIGRIVSPNRPRPLVWIAVLVGAPAGLIVVETVFELVGVVLPVPREWLEKFSGLLLPEGVPLWQLAIMMTVLPGIAEELFFRGVLIYALRGRMGPISLCLLSGVVFGLFHTALWRVIPTGTLGVLLAGVTLLTGSIFPAALWHALNNSLGLGLAVAGIDLQTLGWEARWAAFLLLAFALMVIWKQRTLYPGLRRARQKQSGGGTPRRSAWSP
ncbi:MAG: CPBP family intramembrane metalloprotease [Acidobacteriota bacterium]|nr:MAG: CPBP family intramembrane metalloprotease [Acidobacteriota bacterium]